VNPLLAIAVVTGISALLFLGLSLAGKYCDWIAAIARVDQERARRISIMIVVASLGLMGVVNRFDRAEQLRSRSLDHGLILINSVQPVYPPLAKQARVQGSVRFSTVIGVNGHVEELKLIEGNPLLVPAAREAASQWAFKKPTAHGKPVKAKTELEVNFRLDPPQ
jgi:TonB family protein